MWTLDGCQCCCFAVLEERWWVEAFVLLSAQGASLPAPEVVLDPTVAGVTGLKPICFPHHIHVGEATLSSCLTCFCLTGDQPQLHAGRGQLGCEYHFGNPSHLEVTGHIQRADTTNRLCLVAGSIWRDTGGTCSAPALTIQAGMCL